MIMTGLASEGTVFGQNTAFFRMHTLNKVPFAVILSKGYLSDFVELEKIQQAN